MPKKNCVFSHLQAKSCAFYKGLSTDNCWKNKEDLFFDHSKNHLV